MKTSFGRTLILKQPSTNISTWIADDHGFPWPFRSVNFDDGKCFLWCPRYTTVESGRWHVWKTFGFANPLDTSEPSQLVGLVVCSGADHPKA